MNNSIKINKKFLTQNYLIETIKISKINLIFF
jgi:hypothetical protein